MVVDVVLVVGVVVVCTLITCNLFGRTGVPYVVWICQTHDDNAAVILLECPALAVVLDLGHQIHISKVTTVITPRNIFLRL